ncbi:DUF2254 domain-containing protein [Sandaracinobacteroides sp. A072]|uniref:DUF2254 domain-containing protein n=1 Tax=Sandaracinobacteroides sp. A072 TaxID=3461146 RepID=UPI0040410614
MEQLWVRSGLFSLAGVVTAVLAIFAGPYIPDSFEIEVAARSVDSILEILASSMLAVTTFSLSVMVSAYGSATSNVTPRSIHLLISDPVAQNTLSSFIGAFLFSIVGIIGLKAGIYDKGGRIILFLATLVVLFIITYQLLRWINQLNHFGRVADTVRRVEEAAIEAARLWGNRPALGGMPATDAAPDVIHPVCAGTSGHVRHVDLGELDEVAEEADLSIHVCAMPGSYVHAGDTLLLLNRKPDKDMAARLASHVTIGRQREFSQDLRYGLVVLSEVASRALSPAVNDPGTAVDVIYAGGRVLRTFLDARPEADAPDCRRVTARDIDLVETVADFFAPIARDGASMLEVQTVLQRTLASLASVAREQGLDQPFLVSGMAAGEHALHMLVNHDEKRRMRSEMLWQTMNR